MKKSLLAVAALGAFASAAQAQSSVTVYGILDVGYIGSNTSAQNAGTNKVIKQTTSAFSDSAESTSRLGFKGTEDLGGGLSAFFTIETAVSPNASTAISSSTTSNRQVFAGLKKSGIGDFAVGTQYTPIHNAVSATDPGMTNNVGGNVVYDRVFSSTASSSPNGNNSGYTVRVANALTLNTEKMAGFQVHGILIQNNANATQTATSTSTANGGINNQNGWGIGVDYAWQKLFVTANYQSLTSKQTANTTVPTVASVWGVGGANSAGYNIQDNQQYYAATYDFGILKAYAQYVNRKASSQISNNYYVSRSAEQIGVRSYITPTIEAWVSGGLGKTAAYGASVPSASFNAWQLGSNYWLSKRTNLYAIYGQASTSNFSTSSSVNMSSFNGNSYAVGLRHTF
ncbi:porin [Polynucleobacter sp. MWH-Svant-W18]|uniref:porin n=1 Tax=Polynucleobacter sp. MWH-Svant-W18 TaxID=1855909 RepID=UPI001BFD5F68|nr:porin [Polynucleobacter sp. MWH-Svant-W18]QWD78100.1 porin [Polynucleobacter sp. MWH-Svant-W18]